MQLILFMLTNKRKDYRFIIENKYKGECYEKTFIISYMLFRYSMSI